MKGFHTKGPGFIGAKNITDVNGPGALDITAAINSITTTGTGDALTLVDGGSAQTMVIVYEAETAGGDTAILTPDNLSGGTTITFNNVGDTAVLKFVKGSWYFLSGTAVVA